MRKVRDYKQVVEERYNSSDVKKNKSYLYTCISPTGRLGQLTWVCVLSDFLKYLIKFTGKKYNELMFCDCGCGTGDLTRRISDCLGSPQNVCGFEFSQRHLEKCKAMNNKIEYRYGNLVKEIPEFECAEKFDGMIASTVFMHIRKKEDVLAGLCNIRKKLTDSGIFMWYEASAETHYVEDDKDGRGFSEKEMIECAAEAGLKLVKSMRLNPILPIIGDIYYYKGNKIPEGLKLFLQYHNKPFKCLNNVMWFMKDEGQEL